MNTKKLTLISMFLGLALIIFIIEAQIPPIVPIPGVKLGLANIINLIALYMMGRKESFIILVLRIIMSSIFTGNGAGFMYSLAGGFICFMTMGILSFFIKERHLWIVSVFGAIGHNMGQITIAMLLLRTHYIIWYAPVLVISAIITGLFTGLTAQFIMHSIRKAENVKTFLEEQDNV